MVIAEDILENQKLKSAGSAKKERQKELQSPPTKKRCAEKTLNKKSRPDKQIKNNKTKGTLTPIISCPDDLTGKLVYTSFNW